MARTSTITTWQRILIAFVILVGAASATTTPTTTTLSVSSSNVSAGTMVTLTASVAAGATPVTAGLVNFCNASAPHCEDAAVFGSVWMTKAGTATLRKPFGPGSQNIQAVFKGTNAYAASTSATSIITVTGLLPVATTSTISSAGAVGNYTLTGTVMAPPGTPGPTGTVSFLDTTNENYAVQSATLGSPTFGVSAPASTQILPSGDRDYVPIAGDFNNDGILDLAIVDYAKDNIYIYLGNGNGTFTLKSTIAVANAAACPQVIATGDLNGDGNLDLVVANDSNEVYVFLGNGDGTFTLKSSPATGSVPSSVAIADFNSDGIPDIAVTNYTSKTVSILLGNGDGTFTLKSSPAVGSEPYTGIVAGDFLGNGNQDLAVPNYGGNSVSILLGNGDGTFAAATTLSTGSTYLYPEYILEGDFNGDGIPDLAVLAVTNAGVPGIEVFLGNGNGTFTLNSIIAGSASMAAPSIGDFNGDGILDIAAQSAAAGGMAPWTLQYYLGNGNGTFTLSPNAVSMPEIAHNSVAGDFDGDGYQDIALMTWPSTFPNTITTYLQRQAATATATGVAVPGPGSHNVLASYSGDGFNSASESSTIALTGGTISTTTSVSASPSTPVLDVAATITASISPSAVGGYAPSGTVTFKEGTTTLGTGTLSGGQATIPYTFSSVGSQSITATYSGDSNFVTSNVTNAVTVAPGTPVLTCSQYEPPIYWGYAGNPLGISYTLKGPNGVGIGKQTGYQVSLYIDNNPTALATGTANSSGTLTSSNWTAITGGNHTFTITWPGDSTWLPTSCTIPVTVNPYDNLQGYDPTVSPALTTFGTPIAMTFSFYEGNPAVTPPTGTITIYDNGVPVSTGPVNTSQWSSGIISYSTTISTLPVGIAQTLSASYNGDSNYAAVTGQEVYYVYIYPAPTPITWPTPAAITYGTPLSAVQLKASTGAEAGTFAYAPPAGTVLGAGAQTLSVTFTPTDGGIYSNQTTTVALQVNQATPVVTWATPTTITYGAALSSTQLDATANVPGTFTYSPALGTVPAAGTQTLSVTFTPTDSTDYSVQTATVVLPVNQAVPQMVWPMPTAVPQGTALSNAQLNASVNGVSGTVSYVPALGTVLNTAGAQTVTATFIPSSPNYKSVIQTKTLYVQILPTLKWSQPAAIPYGTTLWGEQQSAIANVPGTFVYSPAPGTLLPAGAHTLSVTFTPTDTTTYATATATVPLTITQATPVLTYNPPPAVPYGTGLWAQQLNASASVPGSFTYSQTAGTVLNIGPQTVTATFTPTDTVDYVSGATVSTTVNVIRANPVITWSGLSAVPVGTALSSTQFDATASVPGTFVYTPAAGTVLSTSGVQTLSVNFTPTDTVHYAPVSATTTVAVVGATAPIVKTTPVVTWPTPAGITAGTALSSLQLDATASVQGIFTYSPAAGTVLPVGTQALVVTFTPTDTTHYNVAGAIVMLTVNAAPIATKVTWNQPAPILYGTALWGAQLNASANVPGTFVYNPAAGTILAPGTQTLSVTFTPTNAAYAVQAATVPLVVNQIVPVLNWNTPPVMTAGSALWAEQLNASASVPGTFVYTPAAGTVLTTGTYTLSATFTPADAVHYSGGTASTTLTVK